MVEALNSTLAVFQVWRWKSPDNKTLCSLRWSESVTRGGEIIINNNNTTNNINNINNNINNINDNDDDDNNNNKNNNNNNNDNVDFL